MLLSENPVWFDIGEMDCDRYEDEQQVLREFSLPAFNPAIPTFLPSVPRQLT
jgi:hypothetical protein